MRASRPSPYQTNVLVVGLAGAVAGQGRVGVRDRITKIEVLVSSAAAGSFTAVLAATEPDIEVWYENDEGRSDPVQLLTRSLAEGPVLSEPDSWGDVVWAPDAQGKVLVTNDGGAGNPPLLSASPDVDVIVSNARTGEVVASKTDSEGIFSVMLSGQPGDAIQIMLAEPLQPDATSDFITYPVPET